MSDEKDDRPLSQYLREEVLADMEPLPEMGATPEEIRAHEFVNGLAERFLGAREEFAEADLGDLEAQIDSIRPGFLRDQFDWLYTQQAIARVPAMVDRTLRLARLVSQKGASRRINAYTREGARCYVLGLWQASVALARAGVEQALREVLVRKFDKSPAGLDDMIEGARRFGILDGGHARLAVEVKVAGNRVLHGDPVSEEVAFGALAAARGVMGHLQGDAP